MTTVDSLIKIYREKLDAAERSYNNPNNRLCKTSDSVRIVEYSQFLVDLQKLKFEQSKKIKK